MSDQELSFFQELQDEDSICRSMHHLTTAASHHHLTTAATAFESPEKYTTSAYINSTKRQSPLSPSSFQEPVSKRATLHFPSSPSTAAGASDADDYHLFGFTKLSLPNPFPAAASPPPLRRTVSEPIHAADAINPSAPPPQSSGFPIPPNLVLNQPLQENPNRNTVLQDSFPFPNAAPVIHRTISDPSPVANSHAVAAGGTPPRRPPLARNVSRSPSCGESPSTKRLRRMKERLREMSQWWNQVVREGEEEDNESENYFTDNIHKDFEVREMAISVAGRLSEKNPAYVLPALRRQLIQLLTDLKQSADSKCREESAKLLGCLIRSCERLILPYIAPIHKALIVKLNEGTGMNANNGIITGVLVSVGYLARVVAMGLGCVPYLPKEESENEMENPSQEAVWVEKNGECLVLHFKCPCGTVYQILLSGNNCYYKLTNF